MFTLLKSLKFFCFPHSLHSLRSKVKRLKISVVNDQIINHPRELVKVLTRGRSCDNRVNGSDTLLSVGLLHTCIYIDHSLDPRPFLLRPLFIAYWFLIRNFSKVCEGGRPLPLYHYLPTTKKFGSWTREATLPVKEIKSGAKCSGILGSETYNNTIMACKAGPKKACG